MLGCSRLAGIDDGFFPPDYKRLKLKTFLVGTLYLGRRPAGIKVRTVTVDGTDGTEKALEILRGLGGADAVFLDGVTVAGFNVIEPDSLLELARSVVVVYKFEPDVRKIERALRLHFPDWERRYEVILKAYARSGLVETRWKTMRVAVFGDAGIDVGELVSYTQLVSPTPEPLRVSDAIASALSRSALLSNLLGRAVE